MSLFLFKSLLFSLISFNIKNTRFWPNVYYYLGFLNALYTLKLFLKRCLHTMRITTGACAIVPLFRDYIRICHIAVQPHSQAHKLTADRLSQSADAGRQLSLRRQQPLILRYKVTEGKKPKKWTCTCTPGDTASVHKENPWNFPFHASSHTLTHWVGLIDSWHSLFLHDTVEIFLDWIILHLQMASLLHEWKLNLGWYVIRSQQTAKLKVKCEVFPCISVILIMGV